MSKFGNLKMWGHFFVSLRVTDKRPKSADQLSKETKITVATVYRLLKELQGLRMVEVKGKEKRRHRPVTIWGLTKGGVWMAKGFQESGMMNHHE